MLSHVKLAYSWYTEGENSSDQARDLLIFSLSSHRSAMQWMAWEEYRRLLLSVDQAFGCKAS